MEKLFSDIMQAMESLANENRANFASGYTPSSLKFFGLNNAEIKMVQKEVNSLFNKLNTEGKWNLIFQLNDSLVYEAYILALLLLSVNKDLLHQIGENRLNRLSANLDNWAAVDTYAVLILGYAWRLQIVDKEYIIQIAKSDNVWQRRSAIVATVALNLKSRGGKGDWLQTLEICALFITDYHDMIIKAVSWALRELAKREPELVLQFVRQNEEGLHSRIKREVMHKIDFGTKN